MFELKVVGVLEAEALVASGWPTRILSLTNEERRSYFYGKRHLHINVNDVSFVAQNGNSPSLDHVLDVLAFTADLTDDDRLLVHCHAGQSRSSAMAIAICIQHGMTYDQAFDHVESVRSVLMPNQLFIEHIDKHFNLDNKLVEYVTAHRAKSLSAILAPPVPPSNKEIDSMKQLLQIMR